MLYFNALFEPDLEAGGFVVTFPDLGWGVTQGETEKEALEMAADAVEMIVRDYIERAERLPFPSKLRGKKYRAVHLPALQTAKAELYMAFKESGMSVWRTIFEVRPALDCNCFASTSMAGISSATIRMSSASNMGARKGRIARQRCSFT